MKNIKELINTYNKLGEEIQKITNRQYEKDSTYLHVENDIIKIAKVKLLLAMIKYTQTLLKLKIIIL